MHHQCSVIQWVYSDGRSCLERPLRHQLYEHQEHCGAQPLPKGEPLPGVLDARPEGLHVQSTAANAAQTCRVVQLRAHNIPVSERLRPVRNDSRKRVERTSMDYEAEQRSVRPRHQDGHQGDAYSQPQGLLGERVHPQPAPYQRLQVRPAHLRARQQLRPPAGVHVRGGAGAIRDAQVHHQAQGSQEAVHPPHKLQRQ